MFSQLVVEVPFHILGLILGVIAMVYGYIGITQRKRPYRISRKWFGPRREIWTYGGDAQVVGIIWLILGVYFAVDSLFYFYVLFF